MNDESAKQYDVFISYAKRSPKTPGCRKILEAAGSADDGKTSPKS